MSDNNKYDHLDKFLPLNETYLWKYVGSKHPKTRKMIDDLIKTAEYDPKAIMSIVLILLQDSNLENLAIPIEKIFKKEVTKL